VERSEVGRVELSTASVEGSEVGRVEAEPCVAKIHLTECHSVTDSCYVSLNVELSVKRDLPRHLLTSVADMCEDVCKCYSTAVDAKVPKVHRLQRLELCWSRGVM
jgi:hypothetical protein